MPTYLDNYSGRPAYELRLNLSTETRDEVNNRSRFSYELYIYHADSGTSNSYASTARAWRLEIEGAVKSGTKNFAMGPSGDYVGKKIVITSGLTAFINHNSSGELTLNFEAYHHMSPDIMGNADISGSIVIDPIPQTPSAPGFTQIDSVTTSSFRTVFTVPSNRGGSAITGYQIQRSTTSNFAAGTTTITTSSASPHTVTGLAQNTQYWVRIRAVNSQGNGDWSSTRSATTSASTGTPHLAVFPKWDGKGFFILLTPPFGGGAVTSYSVTRTTTRPGLAPLTTTFTVAPNVSYYHAHELAIGQVATFRATALVGGVTSGASNSVESPYLPRAVTAPIAPLFDGATVQAAPFATTQVASWGSTAYASESLLQGRHPEGWRTFSEGSYDNVLGYGVVTQVDKSLALLDSTGSFDVMAIFSTLQTFPGVRVGTAISGIGLTDVYEGVNYFGSIVTATDVQTVLACVVEFYDETGTLIGDAVGDPVVVPANTVVELVVDALAPAGAVGGAVAVVDVGATEWAAANLRFAGGAQLSASARYPRFDGSTPDDALYSYAWQQTANASPSIRTESAEAGQSFLQDPDAPVIPAPPAPPVIDDGTLLNDIVWRRYVAAIPANRIFQWLNVVPALSLFAQTEAEREVRIRYWPNPDGIDAETWTDVGATIQAEQIISYIPPTSTFLIDGVSERAFVIPAGGDASGDPIAADHLLFGKDGGPADWPVLNCGIGYILTLDVPVSSTPGNLSVSLDLTERLL